MPNQIRTSGLDVVPERKLVMRFAEIRRESARPDSRSVEVVVATENPVERYDDQRGIVVREVLAMDGIVWRNPNRQLPIVDSHDRSTVSNVLGSVRNLRIEGDELVGDATFASDEESQRAYQKLMDGHLTDFSITASPRSVKFVERGQQYTTRRGDVVDGPADIVTRWMPTDASLVATGADERSVVRRSYTDLPMEIKRMDESLMKPLVAMGMPAEIADPQQALVWAIGHMGTMQQTEPAEEIESADDMTDPSKVEVMQMEDEPAEIQKEDATMGEEIQKALKAERERVREINALGRNFNLERTFVDSLINSDVSLDGARKQVLEKIANGEVGQTIDRSAGQTSVNVIRDERDNFYDAARDGLVTRAFKASGVRKPAFSGDQKPASGAQDFEHIGLRRMAEKFVARMGANVDRMAPKDVAMVALGHPGTMGRYNISREAYHTTGSFANLLLDAANKTLLAGYDEAEYTWNAWARQAASVPDFKNINRIRFSEFGDLEAVPENTDYKESSESDSKESYKVEKFGRLFTVTWETVVNDDLDAISRIPAMQGIAARRTQNKKVYEVLTANAAMADGTALFAADHSNFVGSGSGAAPSVTTLNAGFTAMRTQTGLNGETIINVTPRYLIVPAALEATALELFTSAANPSVGGDTTGSSGVQNIYGPGGRRSLTVVAEPQLDGNSTTAWYLAADPGQIDTVEICFLQGEEAPVLENEWDFDKDVYKYKVRQTFGVKAIDWRGLYFNAGA
jgi:hypothetical protein